MNWTRARAVPSIGISLLLALSIAVFPFADRATAALYALFGLIALVAAIFARRMLVAVPLPLTAFIGFGLICVGHALTPSGNVASIAEPAKFLLALLLAIPIMALLKNARPRPLLMVQIVTVAAVASWFFYDLWLTRPFSYYPLPEQTAFNQRVLVLVLCGFAIAAQAVDFRNVRFAILILLVSGAVAAFSSYSETSQLALIIGVCVTGAGLLKPRIVMGTIVVGAILLVLGTPLFLGAAISAIEQTGFSETSLARAAAGQQRLEIWTAAIDLIWQKPLTGWGIEAVPESARAYEDGAHMWTHPHNMFLQVWLELGAIGAAALATCLGLCGRAALQLDPRQLPYIAGLAAAILIVASVGHGLWQSWWHATLILLWIYATRARSSRFC